VHIGILVLQLARWRDFLPDPGLLSVVDYDRTVVDHHIARWPLVRAHVLLLGKIRLEGTMWLHLLKKILSDLV